MTVLCWIRGAVDSTCLYDFHLQSMHWCTAVLGLCIHSISFRFNAASSITCDQEPWRPINIIACGTTSEKH